jgi:hypothetical protein
MSRIRGLYRLLSICLCVCPLVLMGHGQNTVQLGKKEEEEGIRDGDVVTHICQAK